MTKPNIIIIMADDMGYSDIGCYGSEIKTPHIDSMAEKGMRLTTMYNCARCCPTRASLLTGLYPHQAGIGHMIGNLATPEYQGYLRDDCVTMAEVLQADGYRTLMSGKWHVGGDFEPREADSWITGDASHPTPTQRGFDRFFGTLDGANSFFNPHFLMEGDQQIKVESPDFYYTDAITDHAVDWIDEAVDDDKPFFLYVAHTAPHWPLHALPDDIAKYAGTYGAGWDATRTARHEEMLGMGLLDKQWQISPRDADAHAWGDEPNKEWNDLRMAVYAAQVDRMDQGIGRILTTLRQHKIEDNTLIIFLSDNGGCAELLEEDGWARFYNHPTFDGTPVKLGNLVDVRPGSAETFMSYDVSWSNVSNAPFRKHKRWGHEGGISTPCVIQWPAKFGEGGIDHTPCHVVDLMPTIVEATGASYPTEFGDKAIQPLEGESWSPLFEQRELVREQPIFFEHQGNSAVRTADWKLVREYGQDWELYNMRTDRTELDNLVARNNPKRKQLEKLYADWAAQIGVIEWGHLESIFQSLYAGGTLK